MKHILTFIILSLVLVAPACVKKGQVNNQQTPSSIDNGTVQAVVQPEADMPLETAVNKSDADNVDDMQIQANRPEQSTCDDIDFYGQCTTLKGTITFGSYPQESDTPTPIEWRVLDQNDEGQILIISEKVLDAKPYNTTNLYITWENSTIRSWLNGYDASYNKVGIDFTSDNFIDTAFTAEEKSIIVASNVPAHPNPNHTTTPGNATTDKIFLLSIVEANDYFTSNEDRLVDATRYAVQKGATVRGSDHGVNEYGVLNRMSKGKCTDTHCYAIWWLRSPGEEPSKLKSEGRKSNHAAWVDLGFVSETGFLVYSDECGVRPALWVKY